MEKEECTQKPAEGEPALVGVPKECEPQMHTLKSSNKQHTPPQSKQQAVEKQEEKGCGFGGAWGTHYVGHAAQLALKAREVADYEGEWGCKRKTRERIEPAARTQDGQEAV